MKGQSNVLSTVILTSLLMIVIIAVAGYALLVIESSTEQAEYARVRDVAINLGEDLVSKVCSGYVVTYSLPMRTCGIEFNDTGIHMNISLIINGTKWLNRSIGDVIEVVFPCGKYASGIRGEVVSYGVSGSYVVNDDLSIPLVTEKYLVGQGRPAVKLNLSKVSFTLKKVIINGVKEYVLNIHAYNLTYRVEGSSGLIEAKCVGVATTKLFNGTVSKAGLTIVLSRGGKALTTYTETLLTTASYVEAYVTIYNVEITVR